MIAQAVAAMEPVRALVRAVQWFFRAHENGDGRAAEFRRVECIARGLLNGNVTRNRSYGQNADVG